MSEKKSLIATNASIGGRYPVVHTVAVNIRMLAMRVIRLVI